MNLYNRQSYLDWLRILAIFGVLFYHSARPFIPDDPWHIEDAMKSHVLLEFNFFISRFRMPLLFFISGTVAFFMLQNRTAGQFIGLRFKRLLVPLVFGMLVIVPFQVYAERKQGGYGGSFFVFYPSIFTTGPYPAGNFSWHHLWFIAYLFVYDVLLAPFFKFCIVQKEKLSFLLPFATGKRIYLLMLPGVCLFAGMALSFPQTHDLIHDWCWHLYWLSFLLAGFLFMCVPPLMESLVRERRTSLRGAVISFFLITYCRWNHAEPFDRWGDYEQHPATYVYLSLYAATAWLWVFAALGYAKQYLNKSTSFLPYINSAVYPFYILHQTVIVVLALYVVQTSDTILMKYFFIVGATLFSCIILFHYFIRPFAWVRFLFGMKAKEKFRPSTSLLRAEGKLVTANG